MAREFKKVTHVIFDLDGLLIESETVYDKIVSDIAAVYGKEYRDEVKVMVRGTPEQDTATTIVRELQLPVTVEAFLKVYRDKVRIELANPVLMPGARELVKHLYKNDVPLAIATSSSKEMMQLKMQNHKNVLNMFHHVVCGGDDPDVKHGKPAPDIFLVCASRFPDRPCTPQVLVLEDAATGIRAARAAGMQAVMVPAPDVPEELKKPATLVLNSLHDFQPELFGLPPRE